MPRAKAFTNYIRTFGAFLEMSISVVSQRLYIAGTLDVF